MNWEPIKNVLMVLLGAVGSWIVQRGWVDAGTMEQIIGGIIMILGGVWAAWKGTTINVVATAANLPAVDKIKVNSPAVAAAPATPDNVKLT